MDFYPLPKLPVIETAVLDRGLVVEAEFVPDTPWLLLSLLNEVVDVIIGAVSQLGQELQFSLRLCIGLDLEPLRTVDDVLRHPHLDPVFDQVAVEAPGVELLLPLQLFSDALLEHENLFLRLRRVSLLLQPLELALCIQQDLLVSKVYVQLEHVVPSEILDVPLVSLDLVLDAHDLLITAPVEPPP